MQTITEKENNAGKAQVSDFAYVEAINSTGDAVKVPKSALNLPTPAEKSAWNNAGKIPVISVTAATQQLQPNKYYKWGTVVNLSVTLAPEIPNIVNVYAFRFDSGTTPTSLTIPDTLKWANGKVMKIKANESYEVIICGGLVSGGAFK